MKKATRCLVFLTVASCLLLFAVVPRYQLLHENSNGLHRRQILGPSATTDQVSSSATPVQPTSTSSDAVVTTPTQVTTSSPAAATTTPQTTAPQNTPTTTANNVPQTSSANNNSPTSVAAPIASSSSRQNAITSVVAGQTETIIQTATTASSASPSATSDTSSSGSGGGLGTGSIVGLSVAGGVAVIGIIAFFVWKFTRKRFADFDDSESCHFGSPIVTEFTRRRRSHQMA